MEYSSFTHSNKFNTNNFSQRSVNTVDGVTKFNQPEPKAFNRHDDIEEDIPEEIEDIVGNRIVESSGNYFDKNTIFEVPESFIGKAG